MAAIDLQELERSLQNKSRSVYDCDYASRHFLMRKAIESGDLARVEVYLRYGASPNPKVVAEPIYSTRTEWDWFPLEWAVTSGKLEMVELLLHYKAKVNTIGRKTRGALTALRLAVEQQKAAIVARLLSAGACPETYRKCCFDREHPFRLSYRTDNGIVTGSWYCDMPVLYDAVTCKNVEIAEMLLRKGAKPNLPKSYNLRFSYLTEAIRAECPEMVALLVQFGADVNFAVPYRGTTPLVMAARTSKHAIEMCKILVQHGANIHAHETFDEHQDALAVAILQQDPELIRVLLQLGANANSIKSAPLSVAVKANAPILASIEIVNLLLDHGAEVNQCDPSGVEPLFAAVRCKRTGVAETLLKRGATVDIVHNDMTPLKLAVRNTQENMVQLLVSHGASTVARVFARTRLGHSSEVCCSALDLAKRNGASGAILGILQGSEKIAEPEPAPAGDDSEEKGLAPARPRTPLAVRLTREPARVSLQPKGASSSTQFQSATLVELKRTVTCALLRITSVICKEPHRTTSFEWKLTAPRPDITRPTFTATESSDLSQRQEPTEGGVVIASGRTDALASPGGSDSRVKVGSTSVNAQYVTEPHANDFQLRTKNPGDDSAKAKAMAHVNQRCLRSCELRFNVKAEGGLFSASKTVGEAWFPLSFLEIGYPVGTTAKFLVQLEYKKKRTGTLAFELTY